MKATGDIESLSELEQRYKRELRDLIDAGEISKSLAERVIDHFFDTTVPGQPLRWSAWCQYVEDLAKQADWG
jgi:hypothetical protein